MPRTTQTTSWGHVLSLLRWWSHLFLSHSANSSSAISCINPLQKPVLFSIPVQVGNSHAGYMCHSLSSWSRLCLLATQEKRGQTGFGPCWLWSWKHAGHLQPLLGSPSTCALPCLLAVFNSHWQAFTPSGLFNHFLPFSPVAMCSTIERFIVRNLCPFVLNYSILVCCV